MLRAYSQIPARAKYLLAVDDGDLSENLLGNSGFTLEPGDYMSVTSVANVAKITGVGATSYQIAQGDLYKDLGRQITVVDTDSKHLAVYRQVQKVDGIDTEGVCTAADRCANIFVKVWAADGAGVVVVRTG